MPKIFRIVITDSKAACQAIDAYLEVTNYGFKSTGGLVKKNFHSLAKAEEAYWSLVAKLEGEGNKAKETLDALIEHGNIAEISDVANGDLKWKWKTIRKAKEEEKNAEQTQKT